jgi:lipopolysaccharide biosynthesis glycosyltransferase
MKIEKIYIATHKDDLRLTRICIASIRYWYPEIPIYLIKDYFNGDFCTKELEHIWNVKVFQTERKYYGWGLSKLEPLFIKEPSRVLILDSDIVFIGKLIDWLETFEEDFVVQLETQPPEKVDGLYFSLNKMKIFDPAFNYLNYTFNTGQIVGTTGILERTDFNSLINWDTNPPSLKYPQIFKNGDQGILNYIVMKKSSSAELSVQRVPFMKWGADEINQFDLEQIKYNSPYPFLIHWAGLKKPRLGDMIRSDILKFFEDIYYSKIGLGTLKKSGRILNSLISGKYRKIKHRLLAVKLSKIKHRVLKYT